MTKVINLFAGPGAGKSTVASGLFYEFKRRGISCEYVTEYAKDVVWDDTPALLENQIHIFSEQFRRQYRLRNKVDYIITDSPLLLNSIYFQYFLNRNTKLPFTKPFINILEKMFDTSFFQFDNDSYFIQRNDDFDIQGRVHDMEASRKIDAEIKKKLDFHAVSYYNVNLKSAIEEILPRYTKE